MKQRADRITKYVGLSDRNHPSTLTPYENPNLRNVDFYADTYGMRNGFLRIGEGHGYLRDSSIRLDGQNDFFKAEHLVDYEATGNEQVFFSIATILRKKEPFVAATPASGDRTLVSKGWQNDSNTFVYRLWYDVSLNGGLGGWTIEVRDIGAPLTTSFSVFDGAPQGDPVGLFRYIEFGWFGLTGYVLKVYRFDGTLVGQSTPQTLTWNNFSAPTYIGVGQVGAPAPDDGFLHTTPDYISATVAEFRFSVFDSVVNPTGSPISEVRTLADGRPSVVNRELGSTLEIDQTFLKGYWKLNDGMEATGRDWSGLNNPFVSGSTGPTWEHLPTKVISQSGIRFHGQSGFVRIQHTQQNVNDLFNPANNSRKWTFGLMFFPEEVPGTTTVRDQTLHWEGVNATRPEPLGIRVVGNTIQVTFQNVVSPGALQVINVAGLNLFTQALNKRVRIVVWHSDIGTADQLDVRVYIEGVSQVFGGGATWATGPVPTPSPVWHLGRTVTTSTFPYTYAPPGPGGVAFGVLDDFYVVQDTGPGGPGGQGVPWFPSNVVFGGPSLAQLFQELGQVPNGPTGTNKIQFYLRMNEGSGSFLGVEGAWQSSTAFLYPQQSEGVYWDHGIVEPFGPVEGRLVFDARFFAEQLESVPSRQVLVVTGTTLSAVNLTTGAVTILSGGLDKPGLCTAAQYGSDFYIAARNARRPIRYNGQSVAMVGIEPPVAPAAGLVVSAGTGGTFAAGTYQLYYTFTNPSSNDESNPSPAFAVTLALNDRIVGLALPTSPDPQVTGRRIYMTAVNGLPGDVAYLVAEVNDNVTINPTLNILNVSTTSTKMEYFDNGEAPSGGVVAIFRDYLFVGGNQEFPTRAFFSSPLNQRAFDKVDDFEDLDSDIGDPIIALVPRADVLTVFGRDSRWDLWLTGLDEDPVDKRPASKSVGCVSPQSVVEYEGEHVFVGERNVYKSTGPNQVSISSPSRPKTTFDVSIKGSVDQLLREVLTGAAWPGVSCAMHRSKDQFFAAVPLRDTYWGSTGRNSDLIIFDFLRETWTRWDIECDCLGEVEDETDATWIYAISGGFLVRLDTGFFDGIQIDLTIAQTRGPNFYGFSGTPLAGANLKGLPVWTWTPGIASRIGRTLVVRHTDSAAFLRETPAAYNGNTMVPIVGDRFHLGGITWWADFIVSGSRQIFPKRGKWFVAVLRDVLPGHLATIFAVVSLEDVDKVPKWLDASVVLRRLTTGEVIARLPLPGMARAYRVRIGHMVDPGTVLTTAGVHFDPPVPTSIRYQMAELVFDHVETDAR